MSRKRKSRSRGLTKATDCCRVETPKDVKARYTRSKKTLKQITTLALTDAFEYDIRDEIVGRAYMNMVHHRNDYNRSKATK